MDDDAARPRQGWVLPGLLVALLLAVLATSVVLVRDRRDSEPVEAVQPADVGAAGWADAPAGAAVVAARRAATTYFTLDHRRVRADMDAMRALGTEGFVADYDAAVGDLAARIAERRLVLAASLTPGGAATEYLVPDQALVLVAVDVTTERAGQTRTTRYRTRVALDLVGDAWLVASLDEVR